MSAIIIAVIFAAVVFEFINGFHDTANAITTTVYTRALPVGAAIALAAVMNFLGAFVSEGVAKTISTGLVSVQIAEYVVLAALVGAIVWDLITWWVGLPSSSSHALIGSLLGATIVATAGFQGVMWDGVLQKVVIPLFTSPLLGFFVAFFLMKLVNKLFASRPLSWVNKVFRHSQIFSAAFMAFSHGTNDAQKTMGIITLAMVTGGMLTADAGIPIWVKALCATTIALGTAVGGRKIMRTMGRGVTKIEPAGGFVSETTAAVVIEMMSLMHAPISTTHVISSAVMGVGSARRLSAVKWLTVRKIVSAWVITLPISAVIGGFTAFIFGFFF